MSFLTDLFKRKRPVPAPQKRVPNPQPNVPDLRPTVPSDVSTVLEKLRSADVGVRDAASKELIATTWPDSSVQVLSDALSDGDVFIRRAVAGALMRSGSYAASKALLSLLGDDDWGLRVAVARALSNSKWQLHHTARQWVQMNVAVEDANRVTCYSKKPDVVEPLIELMRDKNVRARTIAAQALGSMRDSRAIPVLGDALKDASPVVRMHAAMALGEMDHVDAVEPLLMALRDEDVRVRRETSVALGKCGDGPRVCDALRQVADTDVEEDVRRQARSAVQKLEANPLERRIFRALEKNEVDEVVSQGPAVIPHLESLVRQCSDAAIRNGAARAIGRIGGPEAIVPLAVAIDDEDQQVRMAAIMALAKIDDARTVDLLISALCDRYWMGREEAAKALGLKGDQRAIAALRQLTKDEEMYVREAARGAIEILNRGW